MPQPHALLPDGPAGLPRSHLRTCLLLALRGSASHGYELLEQVRELGLLGIDAGGLYRALRAMEHDGLLTSRWEPSPSGPARRTYELTPAGQEALDVAVAVLAEVQELVGALLDRYRATVGARVGPEVRRP